MPGYQSSGTEALQALAKEAKDKKEAQAKKELQEFTRAKEAEMMARRIAAFSDCG
tara:strand:+ start:266 stop:430 length:165 start_codon:yes stop_codon:yes gene_type:complete